MSQYTKCIVTEAVAWLDGIVGKAGGLCQDTMNCIVTGELV